MRWFSAEAFTVLVGVLLILLGVSLVVKTFWNVDIPLFRLGLAILFIYIGLGLIFQPPWRAGKVQYRGKYYRDGAEKTWVFSSAAMKLDEETRELNVIFSSLDADFTDLKAGERREIECHAVFGSLVVKLPKDVPVRLEANSVFGSVILPDRKSVSFGSLSSGGDSLVVIRADAVFGSIEFTVE